VNGVGHLSLPFHGEVVHQITGVLSHLDEQDTVA
jgi:triacylglycerol lipase